MPLSTMTTNRQITMKVIDIVITDDFKENWLSEFKVTLPDDTTPIPYEMFDNVFAKYVDNYFCYYDNGKSPGENLLLKWIEYKTRYEEQLVRKLDALIDIKHFKNGWIEDNTGRVNIENNTTKTETNVLEGETVVAREVSDNGTDNTTTTNNSSTEGMKSAFNSSDYEPSTEVSSSGAISTDKTVTNSTTDDSTTSRNDNRTISITDVNVVDEDNNNYIIHTDTTFKTENERLDYVARINIKTEFIDGFARYCLI